MSDRFVHIQLRTVVGEIDYQKLNVVTITNAFPLPFTNGVLDAVAGHEMYSFLDGFNGYNQIHMYSFLDGVFVAVVMMFGLKTTPGTFQCITTEIFVNTYLLLCRSSSMTSLCTAHKPNTYYTYDFF